MNCLDSQAPGFVGYTAIGDYQGNYHLASDSPCRNRGTVSAVTNDPDGTRNDMGAYGGPGSADFFPDPDGGPIVTDLTVSPASVPQGGTITIQATGEAR